MDTARASFLKKLGNFFQLSKKGRGGLSTLPTPLVARLNALRVAFMLRDAGGNPYILRKSIKIPVIRTFSSIFPVKKPAT